MNFNTYLTEATKLFEKTMEPKEKKVNFKLYLDSFKHDFDDADAVQDLTDYMMSKYGSTSEKIEDFRRSGEVSASLFKDYIKHSEFKKPL